MSEQTTTQEERVLAALAHGGVLLGFFTSGIGGVLAALVIWLVERGKSAFAAAQALQALVYQVFAFLVVGVAWCCWGAVWLALILVPLWTNPQGFEGSAPPAGVWIGLALMAVPVGVWVLTVLYGLFGGVRCLQGRDFRYALIGRLLNSR